MATAAELLNLIATVTERSNEAIDILGRLKNNETIPPQLRLQFLNIRTTVEQQNLLIRNLTEAVLQVEDDRAAVMAKLEKM